MAIRLIFLLLVFSNLVVWLFDPFGPAAADREPQHMAQQLHPEKLRIVHEAPAANVANAPDPEPIPPAAKTPATAPVAGTSPAPAAATPAATPAAAR